MLVLRPFAVYAAEQSARQLYKEARKLEKKQEFARAYLLYAQAAAKDPSHEEYWVRAQALRTRAATAANVMPVLSAATPQPPALDTPNKALAATPQEVEEARRPQPPFELKAVAGRLDFDLRGDARALFEQVAQRFGLEVVFDGDYQSGPTIRLRLTDADYRETLYALMTVTSSFIVPLSGRVFMVVKDTEQKRREVENHIAVSIPIPAPITIQEAQELARTVQQLMEIQRFAIDSTQRLAIFRDRASKVRPAQAIFEQLVLFRPQVALEVELLQVGKTTSLGLGLSIPTDFPLVAFGEYGRSRVDIPSGFLNFLTFGGGLTYLGIGVSSANLLANWSRSVARSMLRAELRTLDGMPADFHAGDKYPLQTVAYLGETPPGEEVYRPPPTFNFEDLGLVLKITPKIHDSKEVTLEVEAEYKLLGSQSFNGIPVITNRKFTTQVRLGFDQSAVIAGLVNNTRSTSATGIPGLGPFLGRITKDTDQGELLLTIKPRLMSLPPTEVVTRPIFIGAESRMLTPM
jgi:general secretion pathway protein D